MNAWEYLAMIDREMMMVDVALMEWQGHLDMAALACLDLTVYETETQLELPIPLTVKRVPLTKGMGGPVIGVAEVNPKSGLVKAEIDDQYKELMGFPDAFSIRDEDPPVLDHAEIKAQLMSLVDPKLYRNPYQRTLVMGSLYQDIMGLPQTKRSLKHIMPDLDEHPFFKEQ